MATWRDNKKAQAHLLKADVIMIPHHGSNGQVKDGQQKITGQTDTASQAKKSQKLDLYGQIFTFYKNVGAKHAVVSSHIGDTHKHPKRSTMQAFCQTSNLWSCDAACGYKMEGMRYDSQVNLNKKGSAWCPFGFSVWAPLVSIAEDHNAYTPDSRVAGGTYHFVLENDLYVCPALWRWSDLGRLLEVGSMRQTTRFIYAEGEDTDKVTIQFRTLLSFFGPMETRHGFPQKIG